MTQKLQNKLKNKKVFSIFIKRQSIWSPITEAYLEPCQTSKMESFAKIAAFSR